MNNRREYLTKKKQEYRQKNKTFCLSFSNAQAKILGREAQEYGLKMYQYLKACISAYRQKIFIVPNEDQIRDVELQLLKIGNNINQITRLANQQKTVDQPQIEAIEKQLDTLEYFLQKNLRSAWDLEIYLEEQMREKPQKVSQILLTVYLKNHNDYKEN